MPEVDDREVYELITVSVDTTSTPIDALCHLRVRSGQPAPFDDILECERNASTWIVGKQSWRGGRPHPDPEARRSRLFHDGGPTDLQPGDRMRIVEPRGREELEFFFAGYPVGVLVDGPPSAPGIVRYRAHHHFGEAQLRMALADLPEVGCVLESGGSPLAFFVRFGDRPYELVVMRLSAFEAGKDPGELALLHGARLCLLRAARIIHEGRAPHRLLGHEVRPAVQPIPLDGVIESLEADGSHPSDDLEEARTACIRHLDEIESCARRLLSDGLDRELWRCMTQACEMLSLWERSLELRKLSTDYLLERSRLMSSSREGE